MTFLKRCYNPVVLNYLPAPPHTLVIKRTLVSKNGSLKQWLKISKEEDVCEKEHMVRGVVN